MMRKDKAATAPSGYKVGNFQLFKNPRDIFKKLSWICLFHNLICHP